MGEVCDSLVFALLYLPDFQLHWFWNLEFWIFSYGLKHLGTPWLSPKCPISLSNHHSHSGSSQNNYWNIFLKWKIFISLSKTLARSMCSIETPIFLAHKNLKKITNIIWTLGTFLSKNISSLFGIFLLQKIFSVLDRNGGFYSNYYFTSSNVADFSCASSP